MHFVDSFLFQTCAYVRARCLVVPAKGRVDEDIQKKKKKKLNVAIADLAQAIDAVGSESAV